MGILCLLGIHDWEYFKAPWRVSKWGICKEVNGKYQINVEELEKTINRLQIDYPTNIIST